MTGRSLDEVIPSQSAVFSFFFIFEVTRVPNQNKDKYEMRKLHIVHVK